MCVFIPKLNRARLAGSRTYGGLASDSVVSFVGKWTHSENVGNGNLQGEPLLGSADIQSLADLDNSFAIFREIKMVPFGRDTVIKFLVVIALPLSPLVLTMFSPEELLKRLITVVL